MPDFHVKGNPDAILGRVATMREKATTFESVADGLDALNTDGWTGRAADRFREKFDTEPGKWRDAGTGFRRAAAGLATYASALRSAQSRAEWAEKEYHRGERVTQEARSSYDADVSRAKHEAATQNAAGHPTVLTIVPFHDPGAAIRDGAVTELASARADLETAAHTCAHEVKAGCAGAPSKRNWFESGLAFVGGVFAGAGEAVWDLVEMGFNFQFGPMMDMMKLASGELTPEELAAKNELKVEQAKALLTALKDDPIGFGKNLGKALLDWDTWSDDPARALGHLVPDAIATIATGGAGASLRALRGIKGLHDISLLARPLHGLRSLKGMNLEDLAGLSHLDDASLASRIDALSPADQARLLRRGEDMTDGTMADVFGPHRFDTDYSRPDVAGSFAHGHADSATIPSDRTLVNTHGSADAGTGTYWTDTGEALRMRSEDDALDRLALRDEWYMKGDGAGGYSYNPRDEITIRDFHEGDGMRLQEGTIAPQDRIQAVDDWSGPDPAPTHRPDGTAIPDVRPGGAQQHVVGLDEPYYSSGSASTWTGPAPWVSATPDGAWGGFAGGAATGLVGSTAAGAAADQPGR